MIRTMFTNDAHFIRDGVNNTTNETHGTTEINYQHRFSVCLSFGVIGDQLIGLYTFPQHLTSNIYAVLQDEMPALSQEVPL